MNLVTVEMGRCTFVAPEIPMNGPAREVVKVPLQVNGDTLLITAVSVGNPHCVIFTDRLEEELVRRLGPKVERHPAFPNRINVQWARVASRSMVDILTKTPFGEPGAPEAQSGFDLGAPAMAGPLSSVE